MRHATTGHPQAISQVFLIHICISPPPGMLQKMVAAVGLDRETFFNLDGGRTSEEYVVCLQTVLRTWPNGPG